MAGHKLTAISYLVILASLEGHQLIKANFATFVTLIGYKFLLIVLVLVIMGNSKLILTIFLSIKDFYRLYAFV